jgi:hypothetical protein
VGVVVCVPEGVALEDALEPRLREAVGVPVPDSGVVVGVADGVVVAVSVVVVDFVGDVDGVCEGVSEGVNDELGLVPVDNDAVCDEDEESEMEPVAVGVGLGLCVRVGVCETEGVGVGVGVGEAVRVCVGVSDAAADCDVMPENLLDSVTSLLFETRGEEEADIIAEKLRDSLLLLDGDGETV